MANKSVIKNVNEHVGESVVIGCWVNNKRSSGKIQFLAASRWYRLYSGSCSEIRST